MHDISYSAHEGAVDVLKVVGGKDHDAVVFFDPLADNMAMESKYMYVLNHKNKTDMKTFDYLKELKSNSYKDSSKIYADLYKI